jgi:hypothetical protein
MRLCTFILSRDRGLETQDTADTPFCGLLLIQGSQFNSKDSVRSTFADHYLYLYGFGEELKREDADTALPARCCDQLLISS